MIELLRSCHDLALSICYLRWCLLSLRRVTPPRSSPPRSFFPSLKVVFKDLGPQVGYSTVFFLEYLGPMLIYPLFYFFREEIYGRLGFKVARGRCFQPRRGVSVPNLPYNLQDIGPVNEVQTLAMYYWVFHYAKRILETFLVHTFSHATMPLFNLFRQVQDGWTSTEARPLLIVERSSLRCVRTTRGATQELGLLLGLCCLCGLLRQPPPVHCAGPAAHPDRPWPSPAHAGRQP